MRFFLREVSANSALSVKQVLIHAKSLFVMKGMALWERKHGFLHRASFDADEANKSFE